MFPDFLPPCTVCKQSADECRCTSRNEPIQDDIDFDEEDYFQRRRFEDDE